MKDEKWEWCRLQRWQEPRWDAIPWRRLSLYRILLCHTPCRSLAAIHQIIKDHSLKSKARGGALSHTLRHVWGHGRSRDAKEVVLKRMKYSQLIREIWQPSQLCIHVGVCGQWCFKVAKRERGRVATNQLLNTEQPSGKRWTLTHTLRRGMPLEVAVAHSACLILVRISVCALHGRLFSSLKYSPASRTVKMCKGG